MANGMDFKTLVPRLEYLEVKKRTSSLIDAHCFDYFRSLIDYRIQFFPKGHV